MDEFLSIAADSFWVCQPKVGVHILHDIFMETCHQVIYVQFKHPSQNSWVVRWCTYPLEDVNSYVDNCYIATQDRELFSSQTSRKPAHSHHPSLAQASRCGWNPRTPTPHQWRRERPSCRSQRPQKTTSCKKINIHSHSHGSWIFFASIFILKKGGIWGIYSIHLVEVNCFLIP